MKKQKRREVTLNTYVMDLDGGWSLRALNCLERIPASSIGRIYLWHITVGGIGFPGNVTGLGKAAYNEIRRKLLDNSFPDLELKVFGLGYDSTRVTKSALYEMLKQWKTATGSQKAQLEKNLALHQSSGGH